jgi:hypothetical protein
MVDSFYSVLTQAVADFSTRGFVSEEQLAEWMAAIRLAAERDMVDPRTLESEMAASFRSIFENMVNKGGILRYHDGLPAWRLKQLEPRLHTELDRRIMANAQLIKLNRVRAIETTLQRFSGWSTSIPAGGSKVVDKVETKSNIRKSLAQLPFEMRRVAIDQGNKFLGDLNNIIAVDGGAIAGEWVSSYRQRGYNYREDHKERDSKFYMIPNNWALQRGLVKAMDSQWTDRITKPAEEVFCLPGDTEIELFGDAEKVFRREFSGDIVVIRTASGRELRATLNHPVLTAQGWVAAGLLDESHHVIEICEEVLDSPKLHHNQGATPFSDLFDAARGAGFLHEVRQGVTPDFHGDGSDTEVDIISAAWPLGLDDMAPMLECLDKLFLSSADFLHSGSTTIADGLVGPGRSAHRRMSLFERFLLMKGYSLTSGTSDSLHDGLVRYPQDLGEFFAAFTSFIAAAKLRAIDMYTLDTAEAGPEIDDTLLVPEPEGHGGATDSLSYLGERLTFGTKAVNVVSVHKEAFSGQVYNLQTKSEWYVANGIITHNCRCSYRYVYNLRDLPDLMLTQKGKDELARVKAVIKSRFSAT